MPGIEFQVFGRVQGVGFRYYTQTEAIRLKLTGSAINLPDGSVQVRAYGPNEALESLAVWLQSGPPSAVVKSLQQKPWQPDAIPTRFLTG